MKKTLSILLSILMLLSLLAGCGGGASTQSQGTAEKEQPKRNSRPPGNRAETR